MKKIICNILLLLISLLLLPSSSLCYAQDVSEASPSSQMEEFSIFANQAITFGTKQSANNKTTITVQNLTTQSYATEYIQEIPQDSSNISVSDTKGTLDYSIKQEAGRKQMHIQLPSSSIGMNAKTTFVITFDTASYYFDSSNTDFFEIIIPKFNSYQVLNGYEASLHFPKNWGTPTDIKPGPVSNYNWIFSEGKNESIHVIFNKNNSGLVSKNNYSVSIMSLTTGAILVIGAFLVFKPGKKITRDDAK